MTIICGGITVKNKLLAGATLSFGLLLSVGYGTLVFPAQATAVESVKIEKPAAAPAQTSAPATAPQPAQAAQPQKPAASNVNSVTLAAVKAGVLACTSRINQVITYITANSQSGAYLFLPKIMPDQSIFSASIEVESRNATPIYASASFAPLTNGSAGAVYDAVEYVAQSCDYTEKNAFKDLARSGILRKDIVMLDGGKVRVFLMPAGTGCNVIKKEVVQ